MTLSLALLLAAVDPTAPRSPPTLYERVEQRIAADPAAAATLGRPAPQMHEVDWLIGTWEVSALVEAHGGPPAVGTSTVTPALGGAWLEIRNTYSYGAQAVFYVGYSAMEGHWVAVDINNLMSANRSTSSGWTGDRIVFDGDYTILGLSAHLRETIERQGPDNFSVVQEERSESGWRRLAVYYYHRHRAGL